MDREDDYDPDRLPEYASAEDDLVMGMGQVDLNKLMNGEPVELNFDMGEVVETEGAQANDPITQTFDELTWDKMQYKFLSDEDRAALEAPCGDFSVIEDVMTKVLYDGSLKKVTIRPGTGRRVENGDLVNIDYVIMFEHVDEVFDSTYGNPRRRRRFRVGGGECIPILDLGMATMRVGEMAKFLGTSNLGYGKVGIRQAGVPPDCRVLVQIEVNEVTPAVEHQEISTMSPDERKEAPVKELFEYAEQLKTRGNQEFRDEKYSSAVEIYLEVYQVLGDAKVTTLEESKCYRDLSLKIYCNLSNCYFQLGNYKRAYKYAKMGTEMKRVPKQLKAKPYFWASKAQFEMGNYEEAMEYIKKADDCTFDEAIKRFLQEIEKKLKISAGQEKDLFKKMVEKPSK